jgi:hypothetical protein
LLFLHSLKIQDIPIRQKYTLSMPDAVSEDIAASQEEIYLD